MGGQLSPQGIHVPHFVIDRGIRSAVRTEPAGRPDAMLDPDAIALSYWSVLQQPRSAWTWEMELRPWVEKFCCTVVQERCGASNPAPRDSGSGADAPARHDEQATTT